MRQTQTRIRQYGDFARHLRRLKDKQTNKAVVAASGKLWGIVDDLEKNIVLKSEAATPCESAGLLADKVIALIGQGDAFAQFQKLSLQIRAIAAAQDRALSRCRMAVRRIKQECMMVGKEEPQAADFAAETQQMAEQMLQRK